MPLIVKPLSLFILALIPFFFSGSYNLIIDLLNMLIAAISPAASAVVGLFPPNPCGSLIASCTEVVSNLPTPDTGLLQRVLHTLAWIVPMEYICNLIGCCMMTVMIYFTMAPAARWLKLIN